MAKNVDCKFQGIFLKKYEDSERLSTAIRSIPKIADDRIPEISRRFWKTSEGRRRKMYYRTDNFELL